jgi:hypothetical protein
MLLLATCGVVVVLVTLPLAIEPSPFVAWLAVPALLLGLAAAVARSVPLATASAVVALIEYALALMIERGPVDVLTAIGFGTAVFLLLQLVHFASRVHGAAVSRSVLVSQLRAWLGIAVIGAVAGVILTIAGAALRLVLSGAALPAVVIAGALGALAASAGVILLVMRAQGPSSR